MQNKICTRCNKNKALSEFNKKSDHKDGYYSQCRDCVKEQYWENRESNLKRKKTYRAKEENRQKDLAYKKRYNKLNSKKRVEYNKEYFQKNPEWAKAQARLYYRRHKEKRLIKVKEYKANNRALYNELDRKRRNLKNNLPATLTEKEWNDLLRYHSYRCYYCGEKADQLEKEHKIPLSKGGGYTKENIVPACRNCNAKKHILTEKEFIERQATI